MTIVHTVRRIRLVCGVGLLLAACASTGCLSSARMEEPIRAMWVTRFDFKTQDDVERIMDDCVQANMNTVLFQVRGNGTAFYESEIEPWADELGGQNPGFDPLTVACRAAHDRGMTLHAWVNVMPAWRGTTPPTNPDQLYNKHPDWFWYDQHGERQKLSNFYVSLNPCLPEVREYLVDVFREVAVNYDVDGVHMDYSRFPNEPPAIPSGSGIDYPRDERTLALYKGDTGLTPDEDQDSWNQWRTDQVTKLVGQIHEMLATDAPGVSLTSAVGSIRERGLSHFQDGKAWLENGYVDAVFLMNYTGDVDTFRQRIEPWLDIETDAEIVPGLWFHQRGLEPAETIESVRDEIRVAEDMTGNFCIFAYASMFGGDAQNETLRQRREALIPFLNGVDEAATAVTAKR